MSDELTPQEREFAARLGRHFAPPPMSEVSARRFDRALEARLRAPRRGGLWVGLATASAAALALLMLRSTSPELAPVAALPEVTPSGAAAAWLSEALNTDSVEDSALTSLFDEGSELDNSAMLPDDYQLLASLLAPQTLD